MARFFFIFMGFFKMKCSKKARAAEGEGDAGRSGAKILCGHCVASCTCDYDLGTSPYIHPVDSSVIDVGVLTKSMNFIAIYFVYRIRPLLVTHVSVKFCQTGLRCTFVAARCTSRLSRP